MKEYYFLNIGDTKIGPLTLDELIRKNITPQSLIWKKGMDNWAQAARVPEVLERLNANTTPPPFPPGPTDDFEKYRFQAPHPPCPENYLVWSILSTIFCCLPFGIVAIVKSTKVEQYYIRGDYENAIEASRSARQWCLITTLVALIPWVCYILIDLLFFGAMLGIAAFAPTV